MLLVVGGWRVLSPELALIEGSELTSPSDSALPWRGLLLSPFGSSVLRSAAHAVITAATIVATAPMMPVIIVASIPL